MELLRAIELRSHDYRRATQPSGDSRRRALARLYERKIAVDNLISALQRYQQEQSQARKNRAVPTAVGM